MNKSLFKFNWERRKGVVWGNWGRAQKREGLW